MSQLPSAAGSTQPGSRGAVYQLQLRGFRVSPAQRRRILACTDHATLDTWAARVLTAKSLAEVLAPRV
ncbi:MAG TPA: hypothetical protein VIK91_06950 [Nannocystis sp.]